MSVNNNKRKAFIINGINKYGSLYEYLKTINPDTRKNYKKIIDEILKEQNFKGNELKQINSLIRNPKDNSTHKLLIEDIQENINLLKENFITSSRLNILILTVFSLYSLEDLKNLKISDLKIVKKDEFIQILSDKDISFLISKNINVFNELLCLLNKEERTFLLEDQKQKIDYHYINKYLEMYFKKSIKKGGLRAIRNILKFNKVLQKN